MTIPLHGGCDIGPPLFFKILRQLAVSQEEFDRLRRLGLGRFVLDVRPVIGVSKGQEKGKAMQSCSRAKARPAKRRRILSLVLREPLRLPPECAVRRSELVTN